MSKDGQASSMAKESSVTLQYPLLTRSNYTSWAITMKAYLKAQGVWEAIDLEKDIDMRKDQMALAAIYQGIPEEILLLLVEKETAKEAWQMLKTMHMGVKRVMEAKVQTLKSELDVLRMKEGESIDDFAMKLTSIISKIRALGEKVDEAYVVKKLLRVMPQKFLQVVSTIEQFGDFKTMTMEEVIGRLKAYEERICVYANNEGEHLLLTRAEWRAKEAKGGKRNRKFDKAKEKCYNCQKYGHYSYECHPEQKEEKAYIVDKSEDEEPTLLMAEACLL
uniref:CCHC-type domain-containing protein n=1 Tax=Arundo donax TaxID=35708 RepID=A0A0A9DE89_ARUDO